MFFRGSRYEQVTTVDHVAPDGRIIRYKAIRPIPPTSPLGRHVVDEGERLDHIAFQHYRDAERFWRICDANLAVWPDELTARSGRVLDIPASEA
ncbi:LysM domain-containing protein [Geodermatophilus sp. URMC 60]